MSWRVRQLVISLRTTTVLDTNEIREDHGSRLADAYIEISNSLSGGRSELTCSELLRCITIIVVHLDMLQARARVEQLLEGKSLVLC